MTRPEPLVEGVEELGLWSEDDIVRARQLVRQRAIAARLSLVDQTKIVTATSELARNTVTHGGGGTIRVELVTAGQRTGVRLVFVDKGPGIPDIDRAFADGYSTSGGLGLGLGGARRLVDEFQIDSQPGSGTTVVVTKWTR